MFLIFVFTLSCLPLLVLTDGILFKVEITMLKYEGRKEKEDILFIDRTLSASTGMKVHHARKSLDNQHVVLVLEVEELCHWANLTSSLTSRGYKVSLIPLQECSDYAKELGVNAIYHPSSEMEKFDILSYGELTFYDHGMKTDDYRKMLEEEFKRIKAVMEMRTNFSCYEVYGHFPVKLLFFAFLNSTELTAAQRVVRNEGKATQERILLQSFTSFKEKCQHSSI